MAVERTASPASPRRGRGFAITVTALALLVLPASAAGAPAELWRAPQNGEKGPGAGESSIPRGIAADPVSGHTFVADAENNRVDVFDAWGAFVGAWGWGVADGGNQLQQCGPAEPEPEPVLNLCRRGLEGSGPGQLSDPNGGIAVGTEHNVFVGDLVNSRVEKFDPEGNFVLAFGSAGEGAGQFASKVEGDHIAVGPAGTVFVGDNKGRIQEFGADGSFISQIVLEGELNGRSVLSLEIDDDGDFYVTATKEENEGARISKFSPTGVLLDTFASDQELNALSPGTKLQLEESASPGLRW